ncbi:hypothetical protein EC968_004093 [Mortierella alpina]|nr:hypothetical protein EC968_004093 [Mortierella alpina]
MTRIQHGNVYVPIVKDNRFYRKKPHRILFHPGVVLDVIYMFDAPKTRSSGNDLDSMDEQPHGKNCVPESHASLSSYNTANSGGFMGELGDDTKGKKSVGAVSQQSVSVTNIDGSSASSTPGVTHSVEATSATFSQNQDQMQSKHGAKSWFSGLLHTLPVLSTKSKGLSTVGLPPITPVASTSLPNANVTSGSPSKSKSQVYKLSVVPSSAASSIGDP